ncbi:MAG: hypothetical protein HY871_04170 [Chloroflexi bacterium]|nr:hypothetical protein [Chloroflexota bacterium]
MAAEFLEPGLVLDLERPDLARVDRAIGPAKRLHLGGQPHFGRADDDGFPADYYLLTANNPSALLDRADPALEFHLGRMFFRCFDLNLQGQ